MPPATMRPPSPALICDEASITLLRPEPQTLLMVVEGTLSGIPARSEACRAGAWPTPAWITLPMKTSSISPAPTAARSSAQRIATAPSSGAEREARRPRDAPIGARAARGRPEGAARRRAREAVQDVDRRAQRTGPGDPPHRPLEAAHDRVER